MAHIVFWCLVGVLLGVSVTLLCLALALLCTRLREEGEIMADVNRELMSNNEVVITLSEREVGNNSEVIPMFELFNREPIPELPNTENTALTSEGYVPLSKFGRE